MAKESGKVKWLVCKMHLVFDGYTLDLPKMPEALEAFWDAHCDQEWFKRHPILSSGSDSWMDMCALLTSKCDVGVELNVYMGLMPIV